MTSYRTIKRGFTLVEILIVVIILGILAAIVIPQFTNASEDARTSSATSQLQTMRSQVELYKLQHREAFPLNAGAWDWVRLTSQTEEGGGAYVAGTSITGPFGPYLQNISTNPLNNDPDVAIVAADPAVGSASANNGYVFNSTNGKLWATDKNFLVLAD